MKQLIIFFSVFLLPALSNGEALIEKDIFVNANTLSFSKNRTFAYCFGYEEECIQAIAGEKVSFSVAQTDV